MTKFTFKLHQLMRNDIINIDVETELSHQRKMAFIWSIDDVQEVRPDLSGKQAWKVLVRIKRCYDGNVGVTWDTIQYTAEELFGPCPNMSEEV